MLQLAPSKVTSTGIEARIQIFPSIIGWHNPVIQETYDYEQRKIIKYKWPEVFCLIY